MQVVVEREDGSRDVKIYFDRDVDDKGNRIEDGPSMDRVLPEFLHESKLETIMKRAMKTGMVNAVPGAYYGDFTSSTDWLERQNAVIEYQRYFDSLPAETKDYFANNPANLLDFINDPNNREEAIKLGILKKPEVAPAPEAPATPAPVTPATPAAPVA